MGTTGSVEGVTPVPGFEDITIGIVGTGNMATAHAYRWSRYGIKVFIGSRDPAKGKRLAAKIGGCQGGGHVEMIGASNFLILCIPPGPPSLAFIDQHREEIVGKGKMFVDLSASFTRFYSDAQRPPPPCYSHLLWLRERLNDPTASWVKAWANLMSGSIKSNRCQPVEVAGDAAAKAVATRLLTTAGFEPLDCGDAEDTPKIEPGYHERRWKHPRHLEFNGAQHP